MTRFEVAVLSLRFLALYFLFESLRGLAQVVGILMGTWTEPIPVLPWSLPVALLAVLGVVLFWKAPAVSRSMFPGAEPMSTANRPEIGALALKVCGILLFADFLSQSGRWLDSRESALGINGIGTAMLGAIGAVLFFAAPWLSRRMFGAAVKRMDASLLANAQAVTFAVLGLWLLVTSLSSLAEPLRERIQLGEWGRGSWSQLALAVLGLLLFLGGTGLSAFWYWVRHAGLNVRAERPR